MKTSCRRVQLKNDIGINSYLCVPAHLKCMLMKYHKIKKHNIVSEAVTLSTTLVLPVFFMSMVVGYCSSQNWDFRVAPLN